MPSKANLISAAEILESCADVFEMEPKSRTTKWFAKGAGGINVAPYDPSAVCWFSWGAIKVALSDLGKDTETEDIAVSKVEEHCLHKRALTIWNDSPNTTTQEVVCTFRKAAEQLREEAERV